MPEIRLWFQWRVRAIVNVQAGANMAGKRLNLARGIIFAGIGTCRSRFLPEQATLWSRRRYTCPPCRRVATGHEELR
jgi:hypothetical protein